MQQCSDVVEAEGVLDHYVPIRLRRGDVAVVVSRSSRDVVGCSAWITGAPAPARGARP